MASMDVSAEMDWQELDNAVNQTVKEVTTRFDFKGIKTELKLDQKAKTLTFWCSESEKIDSLRDVFVTKAIKRGLSTHSFEYKEEEKAFGGSVRQVVIVQAGISKEKAKEIIAAIKESKLKVQAQIQDEQVRVSSKNRDDLQATITLLKSKQDALKVPMQFGNYRD